MEKLNRRVLCAPAIVQKVSVYPHLQRGAILHGDFNPPVGEALIRLSHQEPCLPRRPGFNHAPIATGRHTVAIRVDLGAGDVDTHNANSLACVCVAVYPMTIHCLRGRRTRGTKEKRYQRKLHRRCTHRSLPKIHGKSTTRSARRTAKAVILDSVSSSPESP